jgi:acyl-CoA thioesterase I
MLAAAACAPRADAPGADTAARGARPESNARRAAEPSAARGTIVFLGTSLTAGMGLEPDDAYPSLIQRKLDSAGIALEVVNAGVSGETSAGLLRRLDWVLRGRFDVIVVETGANDGLRGVSVDAVRQNLDAILRRVRSAHPDASVALVQMEALPNFGPSYTRGFREIYPDLARAHGVALLPFLLDGVAGRADMNQSDGIHPNERGARRVADNIWAGLRAHGLLPPERR